MRRIFFLFFILFFSNNTSSQSIKKDSLNSIFSKIKSDSLLFAVFNKKSSYYRNRDSELHLFIIEKAIYKAIKTKNKNQEANFKRELGIYYRKKGSLDSAIINYKKSINIYAKLKDSTKINITKSSLANVYKAKGDFKRSIKYFNEVITFFDKREEKFKTRKLITQFNLSGVYINMLEWKTADDLLESIYNDPLAQKNKRLLRAVSINLCATKQKVNQLDKALEYAKIAEKFKNNTRGLADLYTNMGSIYEKKGTHQKAHQYFLKGLENYEKLKSNSGIILAYNNLGNNSIAWGKFKQAEKYLLKSKKLLAKEGNLKSLSHNQKMLANLYEKKGAYQKSLDYLKKDIILTDSILGIEKQKAIANLEVKYKTEKIKRDKDIIEKKSKILELENQKNRNLFTGSLIIILLILVAGLFYYSRLKVKKQAALTALELAATKKRLALEKQYKNSELRALKAQMNPHFIFNAMNSIQSLILKDNKHEAYTYLTKFASLLRENLNISEKSFVNFEEELSLLEKYLELEKLRFREGFEYTIKGANAVENIKIPSMIIQPFVENAIKHGLIHKTDGVKKLQIDFFLDDVFTCIITDNGVGFKASKKINKNNGKETSFSTKSIKEKLQFLEEYYKMNIGFSYEDIKNGTKVIIKVPYKK
ncbi:tetratricopeptide repeat-containing sensor histidine kinase [Polaribacter porphyrae]|uniref:Signal transduction histidine kinase internal region domain-containing protein n=1 Tax=Polaribacter porphyrae TaxID=1137780 RepID=A0A2S7WLZ5_9FLAO|nr:tetratricopeptide repeat protein [Polaribacter porphyrae]PQJ78627.1 hypothetical protein BTO18_05235 [Polaribacter porphyrae]